MAMHKAAGQNVDGKEKERKVGMLSDYCETLAVRL